jgi:hypothetical protein
MSAAEMAARLELKRCGGSWRGDCPSCGYPSTFSLRAGRIRPAFTCFNGCTSTELALTVRRALGGAWSSPTAAARDNAAKRERAQSRALALWAGSGPAAGTVAELGAAHPPNRAAATKNSGGGAGRRGELVSPAAITVGLDGRFFEVVGIEPHGHEDATGPRATGCKGSSATSEARP